MINQIFQDRTFHLECWNWLKPTGPARKKTHHTFNKCILKVPFLLFPTRERQLLIFHISKWSDPKKLETWGHCFELVKGLSFSTQWKELVVNYSCQRWTKFISLLDVLGVSSSSVEYGLNQASSVLQMKTAKNNVRTGKVMTGFFGSFQNTGTLDHEG